MRTSKPLRIFAVLALIIAIMACASRRSVSDELKSSATTTADAMAHQSHAATRSDTAAILTFQRDTTRQQVATADTTAAHFRRATWQEADTVFTEVWINARRFRYHDDATASASARREHRTTVSRAVDTDSVRLISRTDTVSTVQKRHAEVQRPPLARIVYCCLVVYGTLLCILLFLLFMLYRRR